MAAKGGTCRHQRSMAKQLKVLRTGAIIVAVWSCIFSAIQMGIMGWQRKVLTDMKFELDNRQVPDIPGYNTFQARFPGVLNRYTETPERRRINSLFVIALVNLILTVVHFVLSVVLLYGAVKMERNAIWPWFLTVVPSILLSAVYSVVWWSGDVFNEQLTMSYIEFFMAIPLNSIALGWIVYYFMRLSGVNLFNGRLRKDKNKMLNGKGKAPLMQPQKSDYRQNEMMNGHRPRGTDGATNVPQYAYPNGQAKTHPGPPQQSTVHHHAHYQVPTRANQVINSNGKIMPDHARGAAQVTLYEKQHVHSSMQRPQYTHPAEYYHYSIPAKQQQRNPPQQPGMQPWTRPPQYQPTDGPSYNLPPQKAFPSQYHESRLPPEAYRHAEYRSQQQYNASSKYPAAANPYSQERNPQYR